MSPTEQIVETSHGPARVVVRRAATPIATAVISHGAGRGIDSADLVELAGLLPESGINSCLVEQPWVARGRKIADRPQILDSVLSEVLQALSPLDSLVLIGRSAGGRSSVRLAPTFHPVACVVMPFPLHAPGRPERSRVDELLGAGVPTLVIQGERDAMGKPEEFPPGTQMKVVPFADHGYRVPAKAPMTQAQVYRMVAETARDWLLQVLAER